METAGRTCSRSAGAAAAAALIVALSLQLAPGRGPYDAWAGTNPEAPSSDVRGRHAPQVVRPEGDRELSDVLDDYVRAAGGRDALERIKTRMVACRVVTDLPTWDPPAFEVDSVHVFTSRPDVYVVVTRTPRGTEVDFQDANRAWKVDLHGAASAVDPPGGRDAWLADPWFAIRLDEHFPEMAYLGTTTIEGQRLDVVDTDGEHLHRLYFDIDSGLLARLGYNRKVLDYAEVDGVVVPRGVEYSRKGGSSTFLIDSVIHTVFLEGSSRTYSSP